MADDGHADVILDVDLTERSVAAMPYPGEWKQHYIGGRGVGVRIFADRVDPGIDPYERENLLVFATGPLTGTRLPLGSRYDVITKSPLTGTITSANSGGFFGTEMKRAGYDIIVVTGKADAPVWLRLTEGSAEIRDATPYWGMTTGEATDAIRRDCGDQKVRVACIGPAGERLSRIACIINDGSRAAGRGGAGAVMGSKNLKAIAVRGEHPPEIADPARCERLRREILTRLKERGVTTGGLHTHGTAAILGIVNAAYILPTRNYQESHFPRADDVSGETMTKTILVRRKACHACPVACGRETKAGGVSGGGPEYETIWAFGPDCGISDLEQIAAAGYLCNDLGLDTISMGATIACAMEMSEKGYIGEEIRFGDGDALQRLVRMTGYRDGIGDELAEGSYRFAEKYGHPEMSMSVKRQELPAYDPRGLKGLGLNYATSVRGGCHVYGNMGYPEIAGVPVRLDPYTDEGKAKWTKTFQDLTAAIDSSGICLFTLRVLWVADYAAMISAVTGIEMTEEALLTAGERIWNLQKLFNIRAGFTKADDTLPERLLKEPLKEGAPAGQVWEREPLLDEYYALRGWDAEGVPTPEKLRRLGIGETA